MDNTNSGGSVNSFFPFCDASRDCDVLIVNRFGSFYGH